MGAVRTVSKGIEVMPGKCGGRPCVAGTRITAEMVARLLEGDDPVPCDRLVEDYPLSYADIANVRGWDRKGRPE